VPFKHARGSQGTRWARTKCGSKSKASQATSLMVRWTKEKNNSIWVTQARKRRLHQRNQSINVGIKPSHCPKEKHEHAKSMCRLHIPEQALSQGSLSITSHRSNNRLNSGVCKTFLLGRILRLQPDQVKEGRRRKKWLLSHHTACFAIKSCLLA
jgi:hypothetical protein